MAFVLVTRKCFKVQSLIMASLLLFLEQALAEGGSYVITL